MAVVPEAAKLIVDQGSFSGAQADYLRGLVKQLEFNFKQHAEVINQNSRQLGDVANGNYLEIESDGTLQWHGNGTHFLDMVVSLDALRTPASNAPTWTSFVGNLNAYTFAVGDYLEFTSKPAGGYKEGADAIMHIRWATNGVDGTDRYVRWEVEVSPANEDAAFPSTSTVNSGDILIPASTATRTHMYSTIVTLSGATRNISTVAKYRIRRIAASGTAPTSDPFALMVGFHCEQDTVGSRGAHSK